MPAGGLRTAKASRWPQVVAASSPEGRKLLAGLQKPRAGLKRFDWADTLTQQIKAVGLPAPQREYMAVPNRKWRLDLAWVDRLIYTECDGGEYLKASARRHGGAKDCERANTLALLGWQGFRFVGSQIKSGYAVEFLREVLT